MCTDDYGDVLHRRSRDLDAVLAGQAMTKDARLITVSAEVFRKLKLAAQKQGVTVSRVLDQMAAELPQKERN